MKLTTLEQIYQAKRERRKQLAARSIQKRVQLIEKLHEFGLMMRKIKVEMRRVPSCESTF